MIVLFNKRVSDAQIYNILEFECLENVKKKVANVWAMLMLFAKYIFFPELGFERNEDD